MASIHLLGGKKKLLTIQVIDLGLHFQILVHWARVLRRNAKYTIAALSSLALLLLLFTHFRDLFLPHRNDRTLNTGTTSYYEESSVVWNPPATCQDCFLTKPIDLSLLEPYLLLVLIHAKADDKTRRDAIRQTWVSNYRGLLNPPVQYRFVVGGDRLGLDLITQLLAEAERFEDMIILDEVSDSERSLTTRTLQGFGHTLENYEFKYLMKCDDDTFVDLPRIATELQQRQYHDKFYWGYMLGHNKIHYYGKYAERQWSMCDHYLPYAAGGGYVVSRDLVQIIYDNYKFLKKYVCEDVSLGAWLAPYNIERRHDTRFNTESNSRGCKNVFILSHKVSEAEMYEMYESLELDGTLCAGKNEWYRFDGYLYNWTSVNKPCCKRYYGIP